MWLECSVFESRAFLISHWSIFVFFVSKLRQQCLFYGLYKYYFIITLPEGAVYPLTESGAPWKGWVENNKQNRLRKKVPFQHFCCLPVRDVACELWLQIMGFFSGHCRGESNYKAHSMPVSLSALIPLECIFPPWMPLQTRRASVGRRRRPWSE